MSPSSNSQYNVIKRGSKLCFVSSGELTRFKRRMAGFARQHHALFSDSKCVIKGWLKEGKHLGITTTFYFRETKVFTQDEEVRKMDVSNRIKALHDSLCAYLKFDDSEFFEVIAIKACVDDPVLERADAMIYPL